MHICSVSGQIYVIFRDTHTQTSTHHQTPALSSSKVISNQLFLSPPPPPALPFSRLNFLINRNIAYTSLWITSLSKGSIEGGLMFTLLWPGPFFCVVVVIFSCPFLIDFKMEL